MTDEATRDQQLREVLEELTAGRLLTDEAFDRVKNLQDAAVADAAADASGYSTRRTIPKTPGGGIVAGLIMLIFGGILGCVGGFFAYKSIRFELYGKQVEGQVIRMVHGGGKGNGSKPVVAYKVDGKPFEVEGSISSSPPTYKQGDRAIVYYTPADPSDAQIAGFVERWLFPTVFGGIGSIVSIVGLTMFLGGLLRTLFGSTPTTYDPERDRFTAE
jgi:hypothetical protein